MRNGELGWFTAVLAAAGLAALTGGSCAQQTSDSAKQLQEVRTLAAPLIPKPLDSEG